MRLSSALLLGAAAGAASSVQAAPLGFADFEARGSAALDAGFVAVARDLSAVARSCLEASGVAVTYPGDSAFSTQSQPENSVLPYTPAAIAAPASADEVASVTRCVAAQNGDVKVVPKSGGHSYTSASLGGQNGSVVIDLKQHLTAITIDADAKTATVQAGATLGPLAQALGEKGFALPHGTCPTVGVGGHSLGGGWGFTSRSWGWLLDHIVSMQLVTPDGSIKSVNATSEPDLFWALRGAGASNFGTVTEFTYSLEDAPESVVNYSFTYPSNDDCVQLILAVQDLATRSDGRLDLGMGGEILLYGENSGNDGACSFAGQFKGAASTFEAQAGMLSDAMQSRGASTGTPANTTFTGAATGSDSAWLRALTDLMGDLNAAAISEPYYAKSLMDDGSPNYTADSAKAIVDTIQKHVLVEGTGISLSLDLNGPGSATNANLTTASAFDVHRTSLFFSQLYVYGQPTDATAQQNVFAATDEIIESVKAAKPNGNWLLYVNYIDAQIKDFGTQYYSTALERLKSIKAAVDPLTLFDFPQGLAHA